MRSWLIASIVCVCAVLLCIKFVDIPMARFAQALSWSDSLHVQALGIPVLIIGSGLILFLLGAERLAGLAIGRWSETLLLICLSLTWGVSVTELVLKPFFGRAVPAIFLTTGHYGFDWFQGTSITSFPSGHAVQVLSVATVLWLRHPSLRLMSGAVAAVILIVLVLGNWHFVSDVIAGGYLGCLGAFMITMLWQSRPATERRADVR
jgi:membrane-associated phospholipid phosphatase